jgi:dTDP-4-amino-4,6-dideoxygalactose transaminase
MMKVASYDVVRTNAPYRVALTAATEAVLDSGHLILGDRLQAFERAFASHSGAHYGVGVGNGLEALALTLRALGIGPGDEVILPAFTFVATWLAVSQNGARPVPVDVRLDGLMDPALIAAAITPRTRAIVPVHLFGALADMDAILAIAADSGLEVVEDAAQAHGAERAGRRAGSFGIAAAFSFYPTKNLGAIGDGGAVCTGDADLAARVRRLRNYGSDQKYRHEIIGQNSRLDELQAAYLAIKLPYLQAANARRRRVAQRYNESLSTARIPGIELPHLCPSSVWHQFVVRSPFRNQLQAALAQRGVETAIHYPVAPFDQPCFAGQYDRAQFPVATRLAESVLSLPMGDYLSDAEIEHVIQAMIAAGGSLVSA